MIVGSFIRRFLNTDPELSSSAATRGGVEQISPGELREMLQEEGVQLVDVREPREYQHCRIDGAIHIPTRQLLSGGDGALDPDRPVVCYCHHGARSNRSARYLADQGFERIYNLRGGIDAWSRQVDPSVPLY